MAVPSLNIYILEVLHIISYPHNDPGFSHSSKIRFQFTGDRLIWTAWHNLILRFIKISEKCIDFATIQDEQKGTEMKRRRKMNKKLKVLSASAFFSSPRSEFVLLTKTRFDRNRLFMKWFSV